MASDGLRAPDLGQLLITPDDARDDAPHGQRTHHQPEKAHGEQRRGHALTFEPTSREERTLQCVKRIQGPTRRAGGIRARLGVSNDRRNLSIPSRKLYDCACFSNNEALISGGSGGGAFLN